MLPRGRPFQKGIAPNPGGRPKGYSEFRELCRTKTKKALKALSDALEDKVLKVQAAKTLLEFGYGKPTQTVQASLTLAELTDEQLEARYQKLLEDSKTSSTALITAEAEK